MATHDYVIANGTGAAVRSDLNNALAAIVSNNSGSSEPGTTYAYQWWADTNANVLKIRNSANDAWITLRELDGTMLIEDGTAAAPGLAFADDTDTGLFSSAANRINFATGGVERLEINDSGVVFNDPGNDVNFRVESSGNDNMLFVDAGNNRVGIGTSSPERTLVVSDAGDEGFEFFPGSSDTGNTLNHYDRGSSAFIDITTNADQHIFSRADGEKIRIDSSGRLLVGTSTAQNLNNASGASSREARAYIFNTTSTISQRYNLGLIGGSANSTGCALSLNKTRATTNTHTVVQSGDELGDIRFQGSDGTFFVQAAKIRAMVDGTPGSQDMPGRLEFHTTADGASSTTQRMNIDSAGRIQMGDFSGSNATHTSTAQVNIARQDDIATSFSKAACYLHLGNAESTQNGLYPIGFGFSTNERTHVPAYIAYFSEDTGSGEHGPLIFATRNVTTDTAPTERCRVTSDGHFLVAKGTTAFETAGHLLGVTGSVDHTRDNACVMFMNRTSSDGNLIQFYQGTNEEGSISVSGSTVSYNGGHIARWSQLASGAARTEILRGSVLSNLDEMCEWVHPAQDAVEAQDAVFYTEEDELPEGYAVGDLKTPAVEASPAVDAYTENNEQLNRMKVSDVEGDVNVAGVFQAWDDDDDTYTNDFYCAMTGDFVIRIAQGTTVARGDLLMSAGDGTAKPQDDDIVRSKTIAKVTSTTVSTTYSDGSYCVPCVLMAC